MLEGHRSVVNHVRYGLNSDLLISCGVEKIIKVTLFAIKEMFYIMQAQF